MNRAEQAAAMKAKGMSYEQIAKVFGWTLSAARGMCSRGRNYDAYVEKNRAYRNMVSPPKPIPKATQALEMHKRGVSYGKIAKHFGWKVETAYSMVWRGRNLDEFKAKQRQYYARAAA